MVRGEKIRNATRSKPCEICGGTGCGQTSNRIFCFRVEAGAEARSGKTGAWIHRREGAEFAPVILRRFDAPIGDIERRHSVYSALLNELNLTKQHGEELSGSKRKLSRSTIFNRQFKSVPSRMVGDALAGQLSGQFTLKGVPGFWRKDGRWCLRFAGLNGYYIPLRDLKGRVQGLEIRRMYGEPKYLLVSSDSLPDGASSGAPHHFVGTIGNTITVTEGALKAEVASEALRRKHESDFVCGLISVTTFGDDFGAWLKTQIPFLSTVRLAFDSDWQTNDKVQKQMERFARSIHAAGLRLQIVVWESGAKGWDDELLRLEK